MKRARLLLVVIVWAISLVGVGLWAQSKEAPSVPAGTPFGPIISGADIGFQRIAEAAPKDGKIAVRMMIRVNGEWHEAVRPTAVVR